MESKIIHLWEVQYCNNQSWEDFKEYMILDEVILLAEQHIKTHKA